MRPPVILCCSLLSLLPLAGCGESSSTPTNQTGGTDYGSLLKAVTAEVVKATSVVKGVHAPGDIPGAKEKLDAIAARIEGYNESLKTATRPDQPGYDKLRPAAESLKAQAQKLSDEEKRAANELGPNALDLVQASFRTHAALFQFSFDADPMRGELDKIKQANTPPPAPAPGGPPSMGPTPGPFGPSMPGGRPSDPREAGRQSLAAFRAGHDAARTVTVEIEGIPHQQFSDLAWRLKAQTGATIHASNASGTQGTILLYPLPDLAAAVRQMDVGRVLRTDDATRTVYIAGDPAKLR